MPSGSTCSAAACAAGYTGTPTGAVSCGANGVISGSSVISGKLRGCIVNHTCSPPTNTNYTSTCAAMMTSGSSCGASACASGYIGAPSGTISCTNGVLKGELVGCTLPAPCSPPPTPRYATNCGSLMSSGTTCNPEACASGIVGMPSGTLTCSNGIVTGLFSGCTISKKKRASATVKTVGTPISSCSRGPPT